MSAAAHRHARQRLGLGSGDRGSNEQIEEHDPSLAVELRVIKTSGDRFLDTPIQDIGGKGVFTKEIEDALLRQ